MRRWVFMIAALLVLSANSAIATTPSIGTHRCIRTLIGGYEVIHHFTMQKSWNSSTYNAVRATIDKALHNCPATIYPIHMSWPWKELPLTELDVAILAQDATAVKALVVKPIRVKSDGPGGDALHFAAYYGDPRILQILLNAGFPIDTKSGQGFTPLMIASGGIEQNAENTKFLVEHGANVRYVNTDGDTPLDAAILNENVAAVRFLLRHGALVKAIPHQLPPLGLAKRVGNLEILRLVKKYMKEAR